MKKTLVALALASFATSVAADSLVYGGAMVGQSDYDGETSTSVEVHVGTGILPFIGVEGGYIDHGSFNINGTDLSANSLYGALRPSIDLGPLHIYGRVGLHSWDSEYGAIKNDGVDPMYGVGLEYFVFGPVALGAGYHVYKMDDEDVKNFSLTATFHFL
ncbi:outer membrane beta-barrel protein [Vibrio algarum]|uniref:Outer membrane beta-barrel protein n=1 Tax=Vibrio algarum TaxID=3020714 RepID=A0ABT4YQF0_9VIBR|nr:outer membrane beta-barrel protein [Vibrio sp. KJ40-1]MDB1123785.1 outer membrane beta-barrel protein [Vibrio sp. KJ40-1]